MHVSPAPGPPALGVDDGATTARTEHDGFGRVLRAHRARSSGIASRGPSAAAYGDLEAATTR